jgi:hypothetical protein
VKLKLMVLLALMSCGLMAAETDMAEILARLKALEAKNADLEQKLRQAEARPGTTAGVDKALADSSQKLGQVVTAPDPKGRPMTIGGYLDISYEYNVNRPNNQRNNLRVFDQDSNGFNVHLMELNFSRLPTKPGEAGFRADVAFGTDQRYFAAQDFYSDPSQRFSQFKDADLKQAYVEYIADIGNGITLDAGKFVTMHGAEVIEAYDDMNASRSFLFGYAIPFTHTGFRASYDAFKGDKDSVGKWTVMAAAVNGWDNIQDQNDAKSFMFTSNWQAVKWFNWTLNAMYGDEQTVDQRALLRSQTAPATLTSPAGDFEGTFDDPTTPGIAYTVTGGLWDNHNSRNGRVLVDTVLTFTPWEKWTFVLNGDYGAEGDAPAFNGPRNRKWWGVAAYAKYQFLKNWSIANRTEYFDDDQGVRTGTRQALWETTVTADWTLSDPMHIRFEYRHDNSNSHVFSNSRGFGNAGDPAHPFHAETQDTFMLQWLYKF